MRKIVFILCMVLLLTSCESSTEQGKVIFVSAALGYMNSNVGYLKNPPSDQKALASELQTLAEASGEIYEEYLFLEENGVRTMNGYERKWNQDDIISTLLNLDTVSGDLIIFHYSGHGDSSGALVPDIDTSSRLKPEDLLDTLKLIDGKKCLFIDSCYSGSFIEDSSKLENGEKFDEDGNLIADGFASSLIAAIENAFKGEAENTEIWALTAATDKQLSFDSWDNGMANQDKYGAFTYYLLEALGYDTEKDEAAIPVRRGNVTFYSLYSEIRKTMPVSLRREATPQATLNPLDLVLFSF